MYNLQQNATKDVNRKTVSKNVSSNDKIPRIFATHTPGNDLYSKGKKIKESTPVYLMMLFKKAAVRENQEHQFFV